MADSLLLYNCVAVTPFSRTPCSILAEEGRIVALLRPQDRPSADTVVDAGGRFVIPGGIDTHLHLGLAGQSFADDCFTESCSAVSGGTTSFIQYLVDPGPHGSYLEVYSGYAEAVRCSCLVDVAYHIRIQSEQHVAEIPRYVQELHVTSFKFNLSDPVLPAGEKGYSGLDDVLLIEGLRAVAGQEGCIAVVHCENNEIIHRGMAEARKLGGQRLEDWSASRPPHAEVQSLQAVLFWQSLTRVPLMIAHMTLGQDVVMLGERRSASPIVFGETCPQYLMLNRHMPLGVVGKCAPPVRTPEDSAQLWDGLARGQIDCVGSDHCAYTSAYKGSEMWTAKMGLPGTGVIVPILLSEGVHKGRLTLERLVAVTSYNAARMFGFYPQKGSISIGSDADLVVLDLDREVLITPEVLNSVVDYTPYQGYRCTGWPLVTIVRGRVVAEAGQVVDKTVRGRRLEHRRFRSPIKSVPGECA